MYSIATSCDSYLFVDIGGSQRLVLSLSLLSLSLAIGFVGQCCCFGPVTIDLHICQSLTIFIAFYSFILVHLVMSEMEIFVLSLELFQAVQFLHHISNSCWHMMLTAVFIVRDVFDYHHLEFSFTT